MNENRGFWEYHNPSFTMTLLLIALRLDGQIGWSWLLVLFVPMWVDIILEILVHLIAGLWPNRSHKQDKPYGERLYWDGKNGRMYGPFGEDD